MKIEKTEQQDLQQLAAIVDEAGLFPPEMLPDMVAPFLSGSEDELWLTAHVDNQAVGLCYAKSEDLTDGTWNMLALGVLEANRASNIGRTIVQSLETKLAAAGSRLLIVDTSSSDDFAAARAFYNAIGYAQEARIADYWAQGDDKIIFTKSLV